jgi:hypothetical protein
MVLNPIDPVTTCAGGGIRTCLPRSVDKVDGMVAESYRLAGTTAAAVFQRRWVRVRIPAEAEIST